MNRKEKREKKKELNTASVGLSNESAAYDMLFKTPYAPYYLASLSAYAYESDAHWYLFEVSSGSVEGAEMWDSRSGSCDSARGVRPVVSLKSNITPTFVSKDDTTNISTYEI